MRPTPVVHPRTLEEEAALRDAAAQRSRGRDIKKTIQAAFNDLVVKHYDNVRAVYKRFSSTGRRIPASTLRHLGRFFTDEINKVRLECLTCLARFLDFMYETSSQGIMIMIPSDWCPAEIDLHQLRREIQNSEFDKLVHRLDNIIALKSPEGDLRPSRSCRKWDTLSKKFVIVMKILKDNDAREHVQMLQMYMDIGIKTVDILRSFVDGTDWEGKSVEVLLDVAEKLCKNMLDLLGFLIYVIHICMDVHEESP